MMLSLYVDRNSVVHRLKPGTKLLLLPILGTALFATSSLVVIGGGLALVIACIALAQVPATVIVRQLRPTVMILALLFLVQLWMAGWTPAIVSVLRFLALILAASLVTLTTRVADMVDTLEAGLSRLAWTGLDPGKTGLAISLVIRFLPVLQTVVAEVREAQQARGLDRNVFALAVPVLIRTLKMADEIAEAIDARS